MADKLTNIPNNDKQKCPFCRIQLVVETFGHRSNQLNLYKNEKREIIWSLKSPIAKYKNHTCMVYDKNYVNDKKKNTRPLLRIFHQPYNYNKPRNPILVME